LRNIGNWNLWNWCRSVLLPKCSGAEVSANLNVDCFEKLKMAIHRKIKVFIKKTGNGNVRKVVREHYVRDDIPCGHPSCASCSPNSERPQLSEHPTLSSSLCPFPHYLIPDTNIVLGAVCYSDDIYMIVVHNLRTLYKTSAG